MRLSRFLTATLKETPADAEVVSHRLMLRAGMIRRLASGLYTWLPLGLRVLRRVEAVVRDEMERSGALEILMPTVQPAELWQESGRWEQYGPELLRFTDRHGRGFCLGPTHEEIITDLARREIRSYRQLPVCFYQIQGKFRDEIRPRFGVMRAREFLMKDAYSFHLDETSLQTTYETLFAAYERIFRRLGLEFRPVLADSGAIGGQLSHEFHVLADAGEDLIACSDGSDYAANIELAEALPPTGERARPTETMEVVETPGAASINEVAALLGIEPGRCLKTLLVVGEESPVVALCLRGDHELNEIKAAKLPGVASPLQFADSEAILEAAGCREGSLGPVGLDLPIVADHAALQLADFVCGANRDGAHLRGVNWDRDLPEPTAADIRNVVEGDPSPDGRGRLFLRRGIEVGHVFQLGRKYSEALGATCLDEQGRAVTMSMGCYGIGVSRIVAAAIEQHHDARGILWPEAMAPFQVGLLPMNMHKSQRLRKAAEGLYERLTAAGIDCLFDDRKERPGSMFAHFDLIGIPHRLVLSERGLDQGVVEYKARASDESEEWPLDGLLQTLHERMSPAS